MSMGRQINQTIFFLEGGRRHETVAGSTSECANDQKKLGKPNTDKPGRDLIATLRLILLPQGPRVLPVLSGRFAKAFHSAALRKYCTIDLSRTFVYLRNTSSMSIKKCVFLVNYLNSSEGPLLVSFLPQNDADNPLGVRCRVSSQYSRSKC